MSLFIYRDMDNITYHQFKKQYLASFTNRSDYWSNKFPLVDKPGEMLSLRNHFFACKKSYNLMKPLYESMGTGRSILLGGGYQVYKELRHEDKLLMFYRDFSRNKGVAGRLYTSKTEYVEPREQSWWYLNKKDKVLHTHSVWYFLTQHPLCDIGELICLFGPFEELSKLVDKYPFVCKWRFERGL